MGLVFNEKCQWLYSDPRHYKMQGGTPIVFVASGEAMKIVCIQEGENIFSPYRGHFGGIEFFKTVSENEIIEFLNQVESLLSQKGCKQLSIKAPAPFYLNENEIVFRDAMEKGGFERIVTDLNYHINIGPTNLAEQFHESEKRRLKKCQNAGFTFRLNETPDLEKVYSFIAANRETRGYPMTMDLPHFINTIEAFPEHYPIFEVLDGQNTTALTVCIRNAPGIIYSFYPAHAEEYNEFSPLVFLYHELYSICNEMEICVIDLGIATDNGDTNEGLMRFKKHLGAEETEKLIWKKEFN